MFSFEVRRNRKTSNGVTLNVLQNGYLGIVPFFDFDPQNSKFPFLKYLLIKFKVFKISKKHECMSSRYIHKTHTNVKAISLFLAVQWQKKTGKGDDVTFVTHFVSFIINVRQNKGHF